MRKLVIAVIVFSFLGYGPLKTLFHQDEGKNESTIVQAIKDSSNLFRDDKKAGSFLLTEENSGKFSRQLALLLKYDKDHKSLAVGNVSFFPEGKEKNLNAIKQSVEKNYNVNIDHVFSFNRSGIVHLIDLLAPNGIRVKSGTAEKTVNGEEFLSLIEKYSTNQHQYNQAELKALFTSFKNEMKKNQTAEKWFTIGPALMNEAFNNVNTDLDKGELLSLGITAFMNPITTIEPIKLKEIDQSVNGEITDHTAEYN